jgi:serine O-acetyltransferase
MGLLSRDDLTAKPTIEDRVDIGVGACILGEVTVGHDTVIGANSVVVKDVPPNSVVFGVPARPVKLLRSDPGAET